MNLADLIDRNAAFAPDRTALRGDGFAWSYADFATRIDALARGLHATLGVGAGDRVAVLALNHPDILALLYACARLGAMLVPLNWRLALPELHFILADCEPRVLVLEQAFAMVCDDVTLPCVGLDFTPPAGLTADALASPPPAPLPQGEGVQTQRASKLPLPLREGAGGRGTPPPPFDHPLLLIYTSGTTGRPKGAMLAQRALLANASMSQHMHAMTAADHILTVLPFFHVGGLNIQTTPALQQGAMVTIHRRFDAAATLHAFVQDRPTLTVLVPSTMQAVLAHPGWPATDVSALRAVTTGSTLVPQPLVDAFAARGVPVLQVYGATETSPVAIYTRLGGDLSRPCCTGLPGLLCEARVADADGAGVAPDAPGEVLVRGDNVFSGYWRDAGATAAALRDGWYRTGDVAVRDADGYFYIRDRLSNVIVSGGENVYPAEIERVLLDHPDVQDAAVIGVPDPRWQEAPLAFVVPRAGRAPSPDDLRAHLRQQLAGFKLPREVRMVADLPRSALGKVQHFRLREEHG